MWTRSSPTTGAASVRSAASPTITTMGEPDDTEARNHAPEHWPCRDTRGDRPPPDVDPCLALRAPERRPRRPDLGPEDARRDADVHRRGDRPRAGCELDQS